ncbi:hypothetical protein CMI37_37030 [Candidatus Pacearchaeota archaeon]|nr:hypothetical protein [Candidatus Pacearchaeota archaeon]|tara:strand:+ start:4059 stop:4346 length:288 start_codon:yes stop_codon:yes gene_type:complete
MAGSEMRNKLHDIIVSKIASELKIDEKEVTRIIKKLFSRQGLKKAVNNYLMVDMGELGHLWLSYLAIWDKIRRIKKHNRKRTKYTRERIKRKNDK